MAKQWKLAAAAALSLAAAACGGDGGGNRGIGLHDLNHDGTITLVAFGDSITQGYGDNAGEPPQDPPGGFGGYPPRLQNLLGVTVVNAGVGGERTGDGLGRLPSTLQQNNPDYVILLEGANDIERRQGEQAVQNVAAMINDVFNFGAQPIVGTLLPTCCNHERAVDPGEVMSFNDSIERVAKQDMVPVIDFHTAFRPDGLGRVDPASGLMHVPDGLHPTPAGYDLMAATAEALFFGPGRHRRGA